METFPADLVIVASSQQNGGAFIQTSGLQGQERLRGRNIPYGIPDLSGLYVNRLSPRAGTIYLDKPHTNYSHMKGFMDIYN